MKHSGFNMVELAVAVLILGLAVLPLWQVFQHSSGVVAVGQSEVVAMNLGMGFSSQVRGLSPDLLVANTGESTLTPSPSGVYSLGGPPVNQVQLASWPTDSVTLSYKITDLADMPGPAKLATLFIRWKNQLGGMRGATFPVVITND